MMHFRFSSILHWLMSLWRRSFGWRGFSRTSPIKSTRRGRLPCFIASRHKPTSRLQLPSVNRQRRTSADQILHKVEVHWRDGFEEPIILVGLEGRQPLALEGLPALSTWLQANGYSASAAQKVQAAIIDLS